jgi:methylated-DNA-[protein]-cysteine S-methyltransferase
LAGLFDRKGIKKQGSSLIVRYYTYMRSPVGELLLAGSNDALELIAFSSGSKARGADSDWERWDHPFRRVRKQLEEYFAGKRKVFDLKLAPAATPFQARVLGQLLKIPFGETCSYIDIARSLDSPRAARAVGMANANNPIPIVIPCHRVVGANGSLTGFGGGLPSKRFLLDLEAANSGLFG